MSCDRRERRCEYVYPATGWRCPCANRWALIQIDTDAGVAYSCPDHLSAVAGDDWADAYWDALDAQYLEPMP